MVSINRGRGVMILEVMGVMVVILLLGGGKVVNMSNIVMFWF